MKPVFEGFDRSRTGPWAGRIPADLIHISGLTSRLKTARSSCTFASSERGHLLPTAAARSAKDRELRSDTSVPSETDLYPSYWLKWAKVQAAGVSALVEVCSVGEIDFVAFEERVVRFGHTWPPTVTDSLASGLTLALQLRTSRWAALGQVLSFDNLPKFRTGHPEPASLVPAPTRQVDQADHTWAQPSFGSGLYVLVGEAVRIWPPLGAEADRGTGRRRPRSCSRVRNRSSWNRRSL